MKLRLEPGDLESGYEFVNETKHEVVPLKFLNSVDLGIRETMKDGILAGYEMVDLRTILCDGSYHEADSNEMAFKLAASIAFKEAAAKSNPVLLEPMMLVSVTTPEEFTGVVIGDLNSRRGRIEVIEVMEHASGSVVIKALVPLAEILGCPAEMHRITQGRATITSRFVRYEAAPRRGKFGDWEAGVTADKPRGPNTRRGSAAARIENE